jgi:glycosyltransferase involved in cell wall biosynthesis
MQGRGSSSQLETPDISAAAPTPGLSSGASEPVLDRRKRIAFILHKFSRGGSDRVAAYLARGFADAGLTSLELVVFCRGGEVETELIDVLGPGIPVRYLGRTTGVRPLDLILGLPKAVRLLREIRPDVAISTANNTAFISWAALVLAGLKDCRLVLKTTNPVARSRHRGLVKNLRRWGYQVVFRRTSAVLTLSAEESDELRAEYPEAAAIIEDVANPYVTPAMLEAPAAAITHDPTAVVTVARLTAQKRLDLLIAAFALVRTPGAHLKILGEGELRPALAKQIAELGLGDRVSMPGYARDVASDLHRARLFVLTSDYEGLPAALLEAMAANCGVLSTNSFPAARGLLTGRDGAQVIDDTSPAALAALIDEHLARPRPQGLREVAERYSIGNGVASHLAVLRRLP